MNVKCVGALLIATAALSTIGCGGSQQEFAAEDQVPQPGMTATQPPLAVATSTVTETATPTPTGPAAPTPCDAVQSLSMTTMFQGRATSEAPKMQAEGSPICGVVTEGETISGNTFVLQPGNCYTVLAQALPPVTEVDVQLELDLAGGGAPALAALNIKPLLAVDPDTGPSGAIGAKQSCYSWPWPIPGSVKVTVKARQGGGPVGAQVYSRKK
ncbi:hypothetical protein [Chondromyces crocatus]|uniref:Lipoprotein n=1 Tax=Chondromyces crocatus TaxID=52 RepID=A0A0K1EPK6_CHOCO|nr:hypothetical protein [Chondromyces crocatus]AKT42749.1 uncharacterized protein CMC5_069760 [Chondromyces crocatus]